MGGIGILPFGRQDAGGFVTPEEREALLRRLGLSPALLALATENLPHPEFEFRCGPVYKFYRLPKEACLEGVVPLWECCDSVVGCRRSGRQMELVEVDVEAPQEPFLIARSEQGLLFWLFSYLIEDEDWNDEPGEAQQRLRAAAEAVGFRRFDDVERFQQQYGWRTDYSRLLREWAQEITD